MPPQRLKLDQVPNYIEGTTGTLVTKMTVYNWVNKGVKGVKLKVLYIKSRPKAPYADVRVTTPEWVNEFLQHLNETHR